MDAYASPYQKMNELLAEAERQQASPAIVEILKMLIESDSKNRESIKHIQNGNYSRAVAARQS